MVHGVLRIFIDKVALYLGSTKLTRFNPGGCRYQETLLCSEFLDFRD